jgi:hypothetical protein
MITTAEMSSNSAMSSSSSPPGDVKAFLSRPTATEIPTPVAVKAAPVRRLGTHPKSSR